MQYEKSPGPNGIPTEAFKSLNGDGYKIFKQIIHKYWKDKDYFPTRFTHLTLSIIPKSGDLSNASDILN